MDQSAEKEPLSPYRKEKQTSAVTLGIYTLKKTTSNDVIQEIIIKINERDQPPSCQVSVLKLIRTAF